MREANAMTESWMTCPFRFTNVSAEMRGVEGKDTWQHRRDGALRQCSFCGSLHPDDFNSLVEEGATVIPTDRVYKAYVDLPGTMIKFYFIHMSELHIGRFVQLLNLERIKIAYPGHFYVPPAILTLALASPFSFGAILKVEGHVHDGQIVTLLDPFYEYLVDELLKDPQVMYSIDPRRWEEIIAAAYDRAGFDEVILTPRSGDLGRDIIAIKKGFGALKFIEQVKAYNTGHRVTADEVRALLGVLLAEQDASKAVFTTTSSFAPKIESDRLIAPFLPYRLELVDGRKLIKRLIALR